MKGRLLFSFLIFLICLTLVSCGKSADGGENSPADLSGSADASAGAVSDGGDSDKRAEHVPDGAEIVGAASNEDGSNSAGGKADYGDATVYLDGDEVMIVLGGSSDTGSFTELDFWLTMMGVKVTYGNQYMIDQEYEIVVGNLPDRPVSVRAYQLLERMDRESPFEARYLIYAEGGKVAIAYDENIYTSIQPLPYFIGDFVAEYAANKEYFAASKGILAMGSIDLIEEQEELDKEFLAEKWKKLEQATSTEIADAFRQLYSMYNDRIPLWVANLYDPGVGGFYASSAGRNGISYGPDVQCTAQLLTFIKSSGMVDGLSSNEPISFIPEAMQQQMIYFAKSLQDTNGYFYHPQWGKEATDAKLSRRGRDLGWATDILEIFGSRPQYKAANGTAGDGVSASEYWARLNNGLPEPYSYMYTPTEFTITQKKTVTASMETSVAAAVSKVIAAADDSTAYLKSHKAFIDYMLDTIVPGMRGNPYSYGNTLNATYSQIGSYSNSLGAYTYSEGDGARYQPYDGMTLKEITISVLNSCINPEIGMWGTIIPTKPLGNEFYYINGYFKVISLYNSWGFAYPAEYIPKVANAIMSTLMGDEPSTTNICEVYNVWYAVTYLRNNLKYLGAQDYATDADGNAILDGDGNPVKLADYIKEQVNATLKEHAAAAIITTYGKIKGYQKLDGGFSHSYTSGTSSHQGLAVSTGENISDVDATCIGSTGLTRNIFSALGIASYKIPLYTESDWMRMLEIFLTQGPVIKHGGAASTDSSVHDYERDIPTSSHLKVVSNGVAANTFTQTDLDGDGVGVYDKVQPTAQMYLDWKINHTSGAVNTVAFETDILFDDLKNSKEAIELRFYNGKNANTRIYTLNIYTSNVADGSEILIAPKSDTSKKVAVGKVGEWFKLSLRYSVGMDGVGWFKVYVNDSQTPVIVDAKSETGETYVPLNVGYARFIPMTSFTGKIYFDDTAFKHCETTITNDAPTHNAGASGGSGSGSGSGGSTSNKTSPTKDGAITFEGTNAFNVTADNKVTVSNKTQPGFAGSVGFAVEEGNTFIRITDPHLSDSAPEGELKDSGQCILLIDRPEYTGELNTFVFEAKFRSKDISDSVKLSEWLASFDLTLRNSSSARVYRTYFGGGQIGLNNNSSQSSAPESGRVEGEWFTLRLEYTVIGDSIDTASFDVKCYVNDNLVASSTQKTKHEFCDSKSIDKVGILLSKEFVGILDIDDIKIYQK